MVDDSEQYRQVVCAVLEKNGMILAARRKPDQTNGGLWEFPGGKVRSGESLHDALHREIGEELNVAVTIHRGLPSVKWKYPWIAIELCPFVCSLADKREPEPHDHDALFFVSKAEALSLDWAPADWKIVERYFVEAP
jgi:8-oxo-dGTP diphosphatase